jgi:hypothetical protein
VNAIEIVDEDALMATETKPDKRPFPTERG